MYKTGEADKITVRVNKQMNTNIPSKDRVRQVAVKIIKDGKVVKSESHIITTVTIRLEHNYSENANNNFND